MSVQTLEAEQIADGKSHGASFAPQNISQCIVRSGSGYVNNYDCLVGVNRGAYAINFRADYFFVNGARSRIGDINSPSITFFGPGSYANRDFAILREYSSSIRPANARLAYDITLPAGTRTAGIELNVYSNSADSDPFG